MRRWKIKMFFSRVQSGTTKPLRNLQRRVYVFFKIFQWSCAKNTARNVRKNLACRRTLTRNTATSSTCARTGRWRWNSAETVCCTTAKEGLLTIIATIIGPSTAAPVKPNVSVFFRIDRDKPRPGATRSAQTWNKKGGRVNFMCLRPKYPQSMCRVER